MPLTTYEIQQDDKLEERVNNIIYGKGDNEYCVTLPCEIEIISNEDED